ncbi:MAG: SEC-C domain-containing protein [Clostridia bacterium]|nr:SEC-C domain-containing protein [Clostridia bacterium]
MKTRLELLQTQSFRDLTDLCMRFGVEPPRDGERRAEVAARLLTAAEENPDLDLHCIGLPLLDQLAEALKGQRKEALTLSLRSTPETEELKENLWLLQHLGLAWRDRHCWHLLPEVKALCEVPPGKRLWLDVEREIIDQLALAVNRYGIAPIDVVVGSVKENAEETEAVRETVMTVCSRYYGLEGFFAGTDGHLWLRSQGCENPLDVAGGQIISERLGLDWDRSGMNGFSRIGGSYVPLDTKARDLLKRILKETGETDEVFVGECLEDAFFTLQEGNREGALDCLCDILGKNCTPGQRWLMDRLLNRFPVWALRGHSISGIGASRLPDNLRQGRDEPCPCGSGRPYGKCHGRMN